MKFIIDHDRIKGNAEFGEIQISPNAKNGYRPFELFISSLAGCSGTLLKTILLKKKFSYQTIEMDVTSVRNPDIANRIEQISINAYVHSEKSVPQQQLDKIAQLVVKNCGMIQSVIQSIDITFTVTSITLDGK